MTFSLTFLVAVNLIDSIRVTSSKSSHVITMFRQSFKPGPLFKLGMIFFDEIMTMIRMGNGVDLINREALFFFNFLP